ncbi:TPA: hypothetical protein EYP44_01465, partial [Candidatus Bathyarchaeota archaeon]|nr:hypothetical protein [Candidatus Bathyarchaeota archaeon]
MKAGVFFYLSGEHPDLPEGEVRAILEAEGFGYEIRVGFPQVLRLVLDPSALGSVGERAGMTHVCCLEMFACDADMDAVRATFDRCPELEIEGTFEVRVRRIMGSSPHMRTM